MLFSVADLDLLRLLRWCRCISPLPLKRLFGETAVDNLLCIGMVKHHEKSGALLLTGRGHTLLGTIFPDMAEHILPSYRETDILRRLRVAELTLTAYRAGLKVFISRIEGLVGESALFLPSVTRGRGANPWGNTRVAAVAHLGELACAAHWVCPGIGKLILADELTAFTNNTAALGEIRPVLLFAGNSYADVLAELERTEHTATGRLICYGEACRRSPLPVHLLSCDDPGAVQLQIMARPGYREGLAKAALRAKHQAAPKELPDCDGLFDGLPFAVAVDMDLRRLDELCASAREKGFSQIVMAALEAQAEAVLYARYRDTGKARVFALTEAALTDFLGGSPALHAPAHTQFLTEKGAVVDAPPIQTHRKAIPYRREG